MIKVEKLRRKDFYCIFCEKPAKVIINDFRFCDTCGDNHLLKIIKKCTSGLTNIKLSLKLTIKEYECKKKL
jgi:rRNA maturation endonuclease Nob1